jgi:hypothetical protein
MPKSPRAGSRGFRLYVDSLNGVPNAPEAAGPVCGGVPRFEEFQRLGGPRAARLLTLPVGRWPERSLTAGRDSL